METTTIWKQDLELGENRITLPLKSHVLFVDAQHGRPTIWFQFEKRHMNEKEPRIFQVWGTGHDIPMRHEFVGSCQVVPFMWHVFEVPL